MSLVLLIVFGIPLITLIGQMIGGVAGFVIALVFHSFRAVVRYIFQSVRRRIFAMKELNEPTF